MNFKTDIVRLVSESVFEPKAYKDAKATKEAVPKYSVKVLISKKDAETLNAIQEAIDATNTTKSYDVESMLIDCDKDEKYSQNPDYQGCYALWLKSNYAPKVYSLNNPDLTTDDLKKAKDAGDWDELFIGSYVKVTGSVYEYSYGRNKGISCNLKSVLATGRGDAIEPFNPFADEIEGNKKIDFGNLPF